MSRQLHHDRVPNKNHLGVVRFRNHQTPKQRALISLFSLNPSAADKPGSRLSHSTACRTSSRPRCYLREVFPWRAFLTFPLARGVTRATLDQPAFPYSPFGAPHLVVPPDNAL